MKKIYYLLLAFALVLPFSCSKPGSDNSGSDEVKMTDPATKEVATVITFPADKTPELVAKKERVRVKKFEFTEASRYIMTFEPATKASDEEVLVGTYTYKDGVYTLSGIGSVKVSGNNVTVTPASGEAAVAVQPLIESAEKTIILDCRELTYISSSGLRIFLSIRKAAASKGGRVIIHGINNDIRQIFVMTGFLNLFEIENA